jgi:hypothetical protein
MKWILKNWRTSLGGLAGILGGLGTVGIGITKLVEGDFEVGAGFCMAGFAAVVKGWGLLMAKDAKVTGGEVPNAES